MTRRWRGTVVLACCGAVLGVALAATVSRVAGAVLFLVFAGFALLGSPRAFPPPLTDAEAKHRSAADGRPIVYFRPGCPFCMRMRTRLRRDAGRVHWVDIWADPEGAATVRAATGGDETVPTVVHDGQAHVNPAPARVRAMARS
jgi:mycoredoxin